MPLYEYKCQDCSNEFEKTVLFAESDAMQACPQCGSRKTNKKISSASVIGSTSGRGSAGSASSASCGSGGGFT